MSRRPGAKTSNPVLGLVVTALPKTIPEHNSNFTLTPLQFLKQPPQTPDKKAMWLYAQAVLLPSCIPSSPAWASFPPWPSQPIEPTSPPPALPHMKIAAKKSQESNNNQINTNNIVQEPGHDQNKNTGDK
jgi:hypothetical protein